MHRNQLSFWQSVFLNVDGGRRNGRRIFKSEQKFYYYFHWIFLLEFYGGTAFCNVAISFELKFIRSFWFFDGCVRLVPRASEYVCLFGRWHFHSMNNKFLAMLIVCNTFFHGMGLMFPWQIWNANSRKFYEENIKMSSPNVRMGNLTQKIRAKPMKSCIFFKTIKGQNESDCSAVDAVNWCGLQVFYQKYGCKKLINQFFIGWLTRNQDTYEWVERDG